ncbi:four-carbon acid sugar kinase family protein, partial [Burkholderia mallei]|nr:four-carbon acid sugar kinase family protein [Burkholderia mallei]
MSTDQALRPLLGCIADDFTGATDLANMLVKSGMRTVQTISASCSTPRAAANSRCRCRRPRTRC